MTWLIVLLVLAWVVVPVWVAASAAARKGRSAFGGGIVGFSLGWLGVGIVLLLSPATTPSEVAAAVVAQQAAAEPQMRWCVQGVCEMRRVPVPGGSRHRCASCGTPTQRVPRKQAIA